MLLTAIFSPSVQNPPVSVLLLDCLNLIMSFCSSVRLSHQLYCSVCCTCGTPSVLQSVLCMWHTNYILESYVRVAHPLYYVCRTCGTPIVVCCLPYVWHTNYIMSSLLIAHQLPYNVFRTCGTPIIVYCLQYVWHINYSTLSSVRVAHRF